MICKYKAIKVVDADDDAVVLVPSKGAKPTRSATTKAFKVLVAGEVSDNVESRSSGGMW